MEINTITQEELETLLRYTECSQHIIICTHKSPDGDALGASLAWLEFLSNRGKTADIIIPDAYPDFLQWLPNSEKIIRYDKHKERAETLMCGADLIFCLDFNAFGRVDEMEQTLRDSPAKKIMIDHHMDPVMDTVLTVSRPEMSSTCELVFRIMHQSGDFGKMTPKCAACIYCGMMTDTGGFTYNSNNPEIYFIISELLKEAGNTVKEGEVIAKVKVIPDMGQLSSAQSRLRLANINVKQARTDYQREKVLYDKGLVSADEYDKIAQAYRQAEEELAAAEDNLQVVRDGVSKSNASASSTLVRSTITGVILDIPVKVGNSVILSNTFNDGTTIASVADMNDLIFRGNIDETEVGRLVTGMPMKLSVGALQDTKFDASLEYISPKAVDNNGANQFEIKAAVKVTGGKNIRSGYSANAEIVLAQARNVLTIPESAIEFEGEDTYVYIVKGEGDEKTYERRKVTTGLSDGINIEIKKGLTMKDKIRGPKIITDDKKEQ